MDEMSQYFSGEKLYGDDFAQAEIAEWYKDEAEAYANLGARNRESYRYGYHALNWFYGYRHLQIPHFMRALGIGSAYGDEFIPIAKRIERITIIEASDAFLVHDVGGAPVSVVKATEMGALPFDDDSFDLVTCFSVLHHIANISHVVGEVYRCCSQGGVVLVHEPIVSMGDWRKPRRGLTKRERGIPCGILKDIFTRAGFHVERFSYCVFPLTPRLWRWLGVGPFNSRFAMLIDSWLSKAFRWNYSYHRRSLLSQFTPTAAFGVFRK